MRLEGGVTQIAFSSTRLLCAYNRNRRVTIVHIDGESWTVAPTMLTEKSWATEPTERLTDEEMHQIVMDSSGEN